MAVSFVSVYYMITVDGLPANVALDLVEVSEARLSTDRHRYPDDLNGSSLTRLYIAGGDTSPSLE